jgi:tRNA modification GTPase
MEKLPRGIPRLILNNKIDLTDRGPERLENEDGVALFLSAKRGDGIDLLTRELLALAGGRPAEDAFIARERHIVALNEALCRLDAAREMLPHPELFAEELRLAQRALGAIIGEFSADALLGEIFSRFCIGK